MNWGYGNAVPPEPAIILDLRGVKKISEFDSELGSRKKVSKRKRPGVCYVS
jgi:hypothetical protein